MQLYIPMVKRAAPINLPQVSYVAFAVNAAVPPMPMVNPEHIDIKKKTANCVFVIFFKGFIILSLIF